MDRDNECIGEGSCQGEEGPENDRTDAESNHASKADRELTTKTPKKGTDASRNPARTNKSA